MILVVTIISMIALGWLVWITLQRQEAGDEAFQEKLDRDDQRAREGRTGMHRTTSNEPGTRDRKDH